MVCIHDIHGAAVFGFLKEDGKCAQSWAFVTVSALKVTDSWVFTFRFMIRTVFPLVINCYCFYI